jgi:SAM-dependent methyltransferase
MGLSLEAVDCGLCGSNRYEPFLTRGDLLLFIPGDFHYVKCLDCGLVYLNPRPTADSMDEIYPRDYHQYSFGYGRDFYNPFRAMRYYGLKKRVRAIQKIKNTGKLLDVGCSSGDFLFVAREMTDWDVHGVEPSHSASRYAKEQLGLDVYNGSLEQAPFSDDTFDIVTIWNVLEHLPDPLSSLKRINSLLRQDGLLVLNTPNLGSLDARIFGHYWTGFEIPRHFYVFSRITLKETLQKAGFKLMKTQCIYGSHAYFMTGLSFKLRSLMNPPQPLPFLEKIMFSLPARLLMSPLMYTLDTLKVTTAPVDFCLKGEFNSIE